MEKTGKAEGGKGGKETLITETLTHKKGEAETRGNQRNALQLVDPSIRPSIHLCIHPSIPPSIHVFCCISALLRT